MRYYTITLLDAKPIFPIDDAVKQLVTSWNNYKEELFIKIPEIKKEYENYKQRMIIIGHN